MKRSVQYNGELPYMEMEKKAVLGKLIKLAKKDSELHYNSYEIYTECRWSSSSKYAHLRIELEKIPFLLQPYIDQGYISCVAIKRGSGIQIGYTVFPEKVKELEEIIRKS